MLILFVDDDPDDYQLFCEGLNAAFDEKIDCLHVQDGQAAIDTLLSLTVLPTIIFLDINMPIMNGKDCLIKIKTQQQLKGVPVVMYSTTGSITEIETYKKLGAVDFIIKPNTFQDLITVLKVRVKHILKQSKGRFNHLNLLLSF